MTTLAKARRITHFHRQCWTIEPLFRLLKTKALDIEAVRGAAEKPFENLTIATLIAAIQCAGEPRARFRGRGGKTFPAPVGMRQLTSISPPIGMTRETPHARRRFPPPR